MGYYWSSIQLSPRLYGDPDVDVTILMDMITDIRQVDLIAVVVYLSELSTYFKNDSSYIFI